MKKRHAVAGSYLFLLLVSLMTTVFIGFKQVHAKEIPTIFKNDQLMINGGSIQNADQVQWKIEYQKPEGRISLHFSDQKNQSLVPTNDAMFSAQQDGWFLENESQNFGSIQLNTSRSVTSIQISVRLLEDNSDKEKENSSVVLFQTSKPIILSTESSESLSDETEPKSTESSLENSSRKETENIVISPSSNEGPITQRIQNNEVSEKEELLKAPLSAVTAAQFLPVPLSGIASNIDPFNYTTNGTGTFLTNSTNLFNNSSSSNFIRNYSFNQNLTEGVSTVKNSFSNGSLNFENGYHDYEDVLLKKTIAPTSDPNQFDIQLDMIGKALTKRQKLDVVFVIDKSSSMNDGLGSGTRWTNAQTALKKFADDLLATNDDTIHMALASFGSMDELPFSDIAKFNGTYFTNSATTFKNHELLNQLPGAGTQTGSGTPTYLGFDAGYALATNTQFGSRTDAAKVVIMLTDGLPTFGPNDSYKNLTNKMLDLPLTSTTTKNRYSAQRSNTNYFTGNGRDSEANGTISYVNDRNSSSLFQNIKKYSIGYITGTNSVLTTIGKDASYTADNGSQLTTIMNSLSTAFTATVQNATLTDPLSSYVDLIGAPTVKSLGLSSTSMNVTLETDSGYPQYALQTQRAFTTNQIQLSNINLGANSSTREGLRINYRVQIKEAFRDGLFYPTNGTTFINNQVNNTPSYYHFAVPSARVPEKTIDLQVKKTWDDNQNKWGFRKAITFQLQKKINNTWSNVDSQVKNLPANTTNWNTTFTGIPQYQNGAAIDYRVIETSEGKEFVAGYEKPIYTPNSTTNGTAIEVMNKLKTTTLTLKKVQSDGSTPLPNAKFGIYLKDQSQTLIQETTSGSDGNVTLSTLPIGTYILKELSAPSGYTTMEDISFTISQNNQGDLVVQGLPTDNKLVNQLKDFQFNFIKTSTTGTKLNGAVFELAKNGIVLETVTSANDGTVTFTQGLSPGQYTLKETQAPIGYSIAANQWGISIDQNQTVTIKNQIQETIYNQKAVFDSGKNRWLIKDFTLANVLNDFSLKVLKKDQSGNALTGATFKLIGSNQYEKEISGNQSTFDFSGLKPGTYTLSETKTPDGYQSLKNPVTIVIDTQGKVSIDQKDIPSVLSKDGNVIQLSITNHVIMPLPKTGGFGLIPFILIGTFLSLAFGSLLIQRRGGGKNEN